MALAMVGEALISASVEILLEKITSGEFRDFFAKRKLNVSLLDGLQIKLLTLNAVLNDAEEKQITDNSVKQWLDELKEAILDAEDLLDTINTESLRCKVEEDSQNTASKVRSFVSSRFKRLYKHMNSKLEAVSRRLDYFVTQKDILGLKSVTRRVSYSHRKTSSVVTESGVVARENDKEELLNMLLSDDDAMPNNVGVITILGMGGLGKTTLAQLLYNDREVQEKFDLKAWVCVSDFDVFKVTKNLVESVTSKVCNSDNLDVTKKLVESVISKVCNSDNLDLLHVELKNSLKDKKFLLVLDDLWNGNYNDWDQLTTPLNSGKKGSKIIVTTREKRVAEVTRAFRIYELKPLSNENCWDILAKHALGDEGYDKYPILEEIGRKIARKCGGLPLAAKTLGGLLRSKADAKEWERILNSNIWDLPHDDVLPALRLSYLHLPAHLKRCFSYCSIFPKQLSWDRKEMILLWMAEGFLQQSNGEKTMELEGDDCFNELLSRSLLQKDKGVSKDKFGMHDLIYDLARLTSGKSSCYFEGNEIPNTVRHLSFRGDIYDVSKKFESFYELKSLRTFLPRHRFSEESYITRKVSNHLLPKLKCLRVLSLSGYKNVTELPDSIGKLVHLRYLDLSYTSIKRLPDETSMLYNLQTLILSNCEFLIELPERIGNLISLRHLDVSDTDLVEMPKQISRLQDLRCLTVFLVGKQEDGLRIRELREFLYLQGKLSILNLQNVVDPMDASEANLKNKEQIEKLVLEWGSDTSDSQIEKDVLDKLQPSTNLRKLSIRYYGGTSFPNWITDSSFSNIISLSISDCNYCFSLPPFGQLPSLKKLFISRMKMVQTIGDEFYYYSSNAAGSSSFQPFPSLESLKFEEMSDWQEWLAFEGEGSNFPFPCLKHLHLSKCPKLRGNLPKRLPSLTQVCILECNLLEAKSSDLHWNTSIEVLYIKGGKRLLSVLENDSLCPLNPQEIEKCESLPSLPRMILGFNCLQRLTLQSIPSLISFPTDGLPTSLRSLKISYCGKLEFLSHETWHKYTSLENLEITDSCHSLTSFPLGCFPALQQILICSCPALEAITQGGGAAPSLVYFRVMYCEKLKSLPEQIDLPALQCLLLCRLPELASWPQSCLPSNLRSLAVDCGMLSSMSKSELGFQFKRLTSLSLLYVRGFGDEDIVSTLLKEPLLPTSLEILDLSNLDGLRFLEGKGLQHLTSLQELRIGNCRSLESLPEDQLPSSLAVLKMMKCPLLEARYRSQKGKQWSKIAHIPAIKINEEIII